jgi:serine/threonine-protein kinase
VAAGIDLCIELCDALDHAHLACEDDGTPLNIIHRDLKPSNVLVDRRGLVKISDWGLVKSTLNIESTTRGIVKGTPGYIAPEVWGGTRDFQPSVDLFAVGAMLYEVVVGKRLFRGRNLARIAEQVARRKPSEEASHVAERVPDLVPILERALQRVPDRRYQVAIEFADDLREVRDALASRDTFKSFLRSVTPVIERVSPASIHSGASSRASRRLADRNRPPSSAVAIRPASLGPVGVEEAAVSASAVAPAKPVALDPAGTQVDGSSSSPELPPTRAMPSSSAVAATVSAARLEVADVKTKLQPSISEVEKPPESAESSGGAPATVAALRNELPVADETIDPPKPAPKIRESGAEKKGARKRAAAAPVRDPIARPPPPTSAVVVVTIGMLILLAGILITFLK